MQQVLGSSSSLLAALALLIDVCKMTSSKVEENIVSDMLRFLFWEVNQAWFRNDFEKHKIRLSAFEMQTNAVGCAWLLNPLLSCHHLNVFKWPFPDEDAIILK